MHLVLFDIDGTLVSCGPQVRPIFGGALREVFGCTGPLDGYDFSGRTDSGIVLDLMTAAGIAPEVVRERLPALRELYLERLAAGLRLEEMRLLPRAAELLAELAAREDVVLGLLTGNWEPGARIKLGRVGLADHFAFGAFGDDGFARHDLFPRALERAESATGLRFSPERTLIVGDSPLDVRCARAHGAPSVAVATGRSSAAQLAAEGADWVIEDFHDFAPAFAEFTARGARGRRAFAGTAAAAGAPAE